MRKWNPVYRLTIYSNENENAKIITLPLTCQANIVRSILTSNVSATIQIYGLSKDTRNFIYQPPYRTYGEKAKYITFEAGYGDENSLYMLFKGVILQAFSYKQGGNADVITEIQAQSLDLLTAQSSIQIKAGTPYKDIIKTLAMDLKDCSLNCLGGISGELKTDTTYDGNTLEQIKKVSGGNAFIDNGQLNVLLDNECIDVPVPIINADNSLLQTPVRNSANLSIKILFEPGLIVGQLLEINSTIEDDYNGQHKVLGITHDLFFSASQDGQRTTTVDLWFGKALDATPLYVTGGKSENKFTKVKQEERTPVELISFLKPFTSPLNKGYIVTSEFGLRNKPTEKASKNHKGIDFGVPIGTPVKAIGNGTITIAGRVGNYGIAVYIDHGIINGQKYISEYGHLSNTSVKAGQKVRQGQIIAKTGNTGVTTGPHLHLTIRKNGNAINPREVINL